VTFTRRLQRGYQLLEPPFRVERTSDTAADRRGGVQRLVELFEQHIREAPEQSVIFQRVWSERLDVAPELAHEATVLTGEPLDRETVPSCLSAVR